MSAAAMPSIPSPCVQICTLDPSGRLCLGCGRSLDEIARWSTMSQAERLSVQTRLAGGVAASLPTWSEGTDGP
jgi:predicted Fe-S protein YdhL (DUF1289 family)